MVNSCLKCIKNPPPLQCGRPSFYRQHGGDTGVKTKVKISGELGKQQVTFQDRRVFGNGHCRYAGYSVQTTYWVRRRGNQSGTRRDMWNLWQRTYAEANQMFTMFEELLQDWLHRTQMENRETAKTGQASCLSSMQRRENLKEASIQRRDQTG